MTNQDSPSRSRGNSTQRAGLSPLQQRWHEIIFEADTPAGKAFDVALLITILISVAAVMVGTVESIDPALHSALEVIEWIVTGLFTIEYIVRCFCVARPTRYIFSFFGLVDLLAILPSYLSLVMGGTPRALATIRTLRLLRVFRIFKMGDHINEATALMAALRQTRPKITVFVSVVFCAIVLLGTVMYLIEKDQQSGFDSIPSSLYWAIVTMTTVGYGDIAPVTMPGKMLAAVIMLLGYCIIIVPTGIFSAEVISAKGKRVTTRSCPHCTGEGHDFDAAYCKFCGGVL